MCAEFDSILLKSSGWVVRPAPLLVEGGEMQSPRIESPISVSAKPIVTSPV